MILPVLLICSHSKINKYYLRVRVNIVTIAGMKKHPCELSVVVPVYNDAENIMPFYERTVAVLEKMGRTFEIVFVNDGSTDESLQLMSELNKKYSVVKYISFSRNFGKEIALTAGLDYCTGQAAIPIDVDLQDPPEVIPRLVEKWMEGYEVVYARRSRRHGESILKRFTAGAFYLIINLFSKIKIPRNTGDFRLMNRRAVDALKKLREHHRFMKGLFSWIGFNQTGIEYERDPRFKGKTKWNYWKLINFAIEGITGFSYVPLKFASFLGMIIAFGSFIYGLIMIISTLLFGNEQPGYASTVVIILFLGGIQLMTIGTIGEYIGRIYDETKRRTLYIVSESRGFNGDGA